MSIGSLGGVIASAAGAPLAQRSADGDQAAREVTAEQRHVQSVEKAEAAAGVGETDGQDHEAADRDADGRRPWEFPAPASDANAELPAAPSTGDDALSHQSIDPTGISGSVLDLTG